MPHRLLITFTVLLFAAVLLLSGLMWRLSAAQGTRPFTPEGFELSATTPVIKYHFPRGKHKGTTFKGTWIAENAEEVRPNYEIDSAEVKPGTQPVLFFKLSKPQGDWPKGQYRLEIRSDGVLIHTEKFVIQ
ncbi:MAG TPA: hypothetical protein VFZ34_29120 [Blastocatellia bacterium]|nr:hypothetical protein [Blastocatellia bacterium]